MPEITRIVVPEDSQLRSAWDLALAYSKAICERSSPPVQDVVLLVHTKRQFEGTVLEHHVGTTLARTLAKGGQVSLPWNATLRLATIQTIRIPSRRSVVVAFFADERLLEVVDGLSHVEGVVAVPDLPDGAAQWAERWTAIVHGQAPRQDARLIDDQVFEKGLKTITDGVNLSHGVMNPRDKGFANEILRILRAKGHQADPEKIKSWAIRNGWKPSAASELAALSRKIASLKSKPSLAGFHNPEGRYANWKAD